MSEETKGNYARYMRGELNGNDKIIGSHGHDSFRTGDGDDIVRAKKGDDIVFVSRGTKRIYGGKGVDTVIFRETEDVYRIDMNAKGGIYVDTAETKAHCWSVERLMFHDDKLVSPVLDTSLLRADKVNQVQFARKSVLVASDAGEALFLLGDNGSAKGGLGDDHIFGIGDETKVFYEGSMFDYAIHRNCDGSLIFRHVKFGTDYLVNVRWLHFEDGTRIQTRFVPDEWLGNTAYEAFVADVTDPATGQ